MKNDPPKKLAHWHAWLKKVSERFGNIESLDNQRFIDFMRLNGFYRSSKGISKRVWINEAKRVVIKRPFISSTDLLTNPLISPWIVPTLATGTGWLIQHLCDVSRCEKALDMLHKKLGSNTRLIYDLHRGNVGHYRNRPVIFDW